MLSKQIELDKLSSETKQMEQQKLMNDNIYMKYCKTNDINKLKETKIDDPNARGAFGENILHISLLFRSNECAKYLIDNYTELIETVYEDEEYYGESILHMTIATENHEMTKYILENIPNKKQLNNLINNIRAFGHFFNKEWGTVNYGEYPLTFAIAMNQLDTFKLLLKCGANIGVIDVYGNSILHYIVIYGRINILKYLCYESEYIEPDELMKLSWKSNKDLFTPLQYACHLNKREIFNELLIWKRKTLWKWGRISFVAYPLNEIDIDYSSGTTHNCVLDTIIADNSLACVDAPVILATINSKWNDFAKKLFYIIALCHIIYVVLIFFIFENWPRIDCDKRNPCFNTADIYLRIGILIVPGLKFVITSYQIITDIYVLIKQYGFYRGLDVFFQWHNGELSVMAFFHIILILSNVVIILLYLFLLLHVKKLVLLCMMAIVILECVHVLYFLLAFEQIGRLIITALKILFTDVMRFVAIFIIILVPFSSAISYIMDGYDDTLSNFDRSFIKLFAIALGVGEYWDDIELPPIHNAYSEITFYVYLIISTVLLLNLVIAIFTETIDKIGNKSKLYWLYQRTGIILLIQRRFNKCRTKRTGKSGQEYGFQDSKDIYYIAFNTLLNDDDIETLEIPKEKPANLQARFKKIKNTVEASTNI